MAFQRQVKHKPGGKDHDQKNHGRKGDSDPLVEKIKQDGGFTYQPANKTSPTKGYSVAVFPDREVIIESVDDLTPGVLWDFMQSNMDTFASDERVHFGAWYNHEKTEDNPNPDHKIYLDMSMVIDDLDEATQLAKSKGQLGIFDLANFETIETLTPDERKEWEQNNASQKKSHDGSTRANARKSKGVRARYVPSHRGEGANRRDACRPGRQDGSDEAGKFDGWPESLRLAAQKKHGSHNQKDHGKRGGSKKVTPKPHEMTSEEYSKYVSELEPLPNKLLEIDGKYVFQNPTRDDYAFLKDIAREKYPGMPRGEATSRFTNDKFGNKWIWNAHEAVHFQMEPLIEKVTGNAVNQNFSVDSHTQVIKDALFVDKVKVPDRVIESSSRYQGYMDLLNDEQREAQGLPLKPSSKSVDKYARRLDAMKERRGEPKETIAAGLAVIANDTGRILMLQRSISEDDPASGKWEFPGGHIEEGEEPYDAARREWEEEVGLELPEGEVQGWWASSDGVYEGFLYEIPSESDLEINPAHEDREVENPDDTEGEWNEVVAWWDILDIQGNPAIREEVLDSYKDIEREVFRLMADWIVNSRRGVEPQPKGTEGECGKCVEFSCEACEATAQEPGEAITELSERVESVFDDVSDIAEVSDALIGLLVDLDAEVASRSKAKAMKPEPRDGDGDGMVYDGTPQERPTGAGSGGDRGEVLRGNQSFQDYAGEYAIYEENGVPMPHGLTADEMTAMRVYYTMDHKAINGGLRGGESQFSPGEVEAFRSAMSDGLAKLPKHRGEVYRGFRDNATEWIEAEVGEVLTDKGFASSSIDRNQSGVFGRNTAIIQSKTGRDLSPVVSTWTNSGEKEVLFDAGASFKVVGKGKNGKGGVLLKLEEI